MTATENDIVKKKGGGGKRTHFHQEKHFESQIHSYQIHKPCKHLSHSAKLAVSSIHYLWKKLEKQS